MNEIDVGAVALRIPLCIDVDNCDTGERLTMYCYPNHFVINDELASDAEAIAFLKRVATVLEERMSDW